MSSALALSAVTAVLQYMLNVVYNDPVSGIGSVTVSAIAPDIVQHTLGTGADSKLQTNLFLHQVTPNAAWRNISLPSLAADGITRLANQPLALDLHYLLTAYAGADTEAEALLGYAILMLHENPILSRSQISTILGEIPAKNPLHKVLSSSNLADQIEMIKITPATLGREEVAWLWTALKADYRPTFPFQVSVVLIQSQYPSTTALPVLSRNITAQAGPPPQLLEVQPGPPPQLLEVQPPMGQAPGPGDPVTVTGESLAGVTKLALSNERLGIEYLFAPQNVTSTSIAFVVPEDPTKLTAGDYNLTALFTNSGGTVLQSTNSVPMPVAPKILASPTPTATSTATQTTVALSCDPQVLTNQSVALIMGGTSVAAQPYTKATSKLSFQFAPRLAAGPYIARLQVDGVVGPVGVNWKVTPPVFTGPTVTV